MLRPRAAFLAPLIVLLAGESGRAAFTFTANLTTSQEVQVGQPDLNPTTTTGAPRPRAFGTATFVLNDAQTALTFTATVFNIDFTGTQTPDANDNLTNAHIHAGANSLPGTANPVVWGFIGTPFNDNTPNDLVITPFSTGVGGTVSGKWDLPEGNGTTLTAQLPNLFAGRAYINFHTVQFGGGEIRGQILSVPEPSSIALLGLGSLGVIALGRRARIRRG